MNKWLAFAPAIFVLLWSGGYVTAKIGLGYIEPITFLVLRFACVVAIMAVLFAFLRPPLPKSPLDWLHVAIVGFLLQSVYFGLSYLAFREGIAVGTVALMMSLQPILVGLVAPRWVGESVGWKRWCGLLLGLAGCALVITSGSAVAVPTLAALALAICALLGITASALWEKRFGVTQHPITANLIGYSAGLIGVLPFMLAFESGSIDWQWPLFASLAYLVIGNSVIAVGLLLAMIRAGDVARVSALFFLVPPLAAFFAWLLIGEALPLIAWAGMAVAALGVLLATRQRT